MPATEFTGLAGTDGIHEIVDKFVPLDVEDFSGGVLLSDNVGDGVEQMGLAQTGAPIDEKGVVVLAGRVSHRPGGGAGQLVGRAHYEGFEGKFPAVHNGGGFLRLGVLPLAEGLVIQQLDSHVGGEDVLQTGLDAGEEAVLYVGTLEGVGTVEDQLVPLQGDHGGFVEPGLDSGF